MNDVRGQNKRYVELDFIRGLAVFGMIIFHSFYILDFYDVIVVSIQEGLWYFFAELVRIVFLMLVGISMHISYGRSFNKRARDGASVLGGRMLMPIAKQIKRGIVIFAAGLLVTLATYLAVGEVYVRFGILHLIGVSIVFWSLFIWDKYIVLLMAILALVLGFCFPDLDFPFGKVDYFALDYFPIFPWMGVVGIGIFAGYLFYPGDKIRVSSSVGLFNVGILGYFSKLIVFLGRNSLWVYILHVPLILLILLISGILDWSVFF
ncbi:MAG: heparan-alpha-glucosaminide N-acetyltransferase [Patescibacteria group bacterium]